MQQLHPRVPRVNHDHDHNHGYAHVHGHVHVHDRDLDFIHDLDLGHFLR
jgi:hypothetical protein